MSPGQQVRDELVKVAAVQALVGGRIYPSRLPQNVTLPAVVFTVISETPQSTFTSVAETVLRNARVQLDFYAEQYDAAHAVAEAASDALEALRGPGITALEVDSRDLFDNELQVNRVSRDFSVWCGR